MSESESLSAFSEEDQIQLDADKVDTYFLFEKNILSLIELSGLVQRKIRLENEKYLRSHPELAQITSTALAEILTEQPTDPVSFLARFMTDPDLKCKVIKAVNTVGIS